ncbi:MAG: hypothetical protein RBR35_04325 [Salinivirgaceae bacterium]|nr:hypothetical protein [Salinivirgaceae bacterium]MDY0279768.1 hypothetical protein [Salinivirgaceae bacterium]
MNKSTKYIISYSIVAIYMIVSLSFIGRKSNEELCTVVEINMVDSLNRLVVPRDITRLMEEKKQSIYGHPVSQINKMELSRLILTYNPLVQDVGIYRAEGGTICMDIKSRKPILRVINKYGQGYYLDREGMIFPLSTHFSARVLIANGDILEQGYQNKAIHIDSMYSKFAAKRLTLQELLILAKYIDSDEFLKAQIEQIYVVGNEYEMIPKVGSHIIVFGSIDNYVNKFFNLKAIYYKGFSNLGWQKYKSVNLKFDNQVICTKR